MLAAMDYVARKHTHHDAADPDSVIVTLFRCRRGYVRGWYLGPPSFQADVPMAWHTGPDDNLFAAVALVRAMKIAEKLHRPICIVDPDNLWDELQH